MTGERLLLLLKPPARADTRAGGFDSSANQRAYAIIPSRMRRFLTGLILVMLVLFARKVNWHDTWHTMQSASLPMLLLAAAVNLASIVVKGVQRVDDAKAIASAGADGIALSNHGGRQLDRVAPGLPGPPR